MEGNPSKIVHIACAHNVNVPQACKDKIRKLENKLRDLDYEVPKRIGFEDGTASDIYIGGSDESECDLLVAICDHASIGLGILIGWRLAKEKPLLLAAFLATRTARLIVGAEYVDSCVETTYARNVRELVESVVKHLNLLGFALPEVLESESKSEGTHAAA